MYLHKRMVTGTAKLRSEFRNLGPGPSRKKVEFYETFRAFPLINGGYGADLITAGREGHRESTAVQGEGVRSSPNLPARPS